MARFLFFLLLISPNLAQAKFTLRSDSLRHAGSALNGRHQKISEGRFPAQCDQASPSSLGEIARSLISVIPKRHVRQSAKVFERDDVTERLRDAPCSIGQAVLLVTSGSKGSTGRCRFPSCGMAAIRNFPLRN
jgi:hypothetical protein